MFGSRTALGATLAAALASFGCGPARTAADASVPPRWLCSSDNVAAWRGASAEPPAEVDPDDVAIPGRMSEGAAKAARLLELDKNEEAVTELRRVVHGEFKDDDGNRQVAEYNLGQVLYRMGDLAESAETFRRIATFPAHVKHEASLLWILKLLAETGVTGLLAPADLATYDPAVVAPFDNPNQRAVWEQATYVMGVAQLAAGRTSEGAELLRLTPPDGPYGALAARCLEAFELR